MRSMLKMMVAMGLVASFSGCAGIGTSLGPMTSMAGDAWYVKSTNFFGMPISSTRVFYCPAPSGGAAQCKEAKMVEGPSK